MKILRALLFICTFHTGCLAFYFRPIGRPISTSKLIYHTSSLDEIDTRISFKAPTPPLLHLDDHNTFDDTKLNHMSNAIALRGGGCSDSTPALFGKVAASAAVETFLMYQFLAIGAKINTPLSSGIRILQAALALSVVFGSSYFGQLIDSGMSAATRQVLAPNEIPGDADWYLTLKRNPPGWLFPIVWLIVSKPTQFVAIWKLITSNHEKDIMLQLIVYCAHLSLGDAWNKVFFGLVSLLYHEV